MVGRLYIWSQDSAPVASTVADMQTQIESLNGSKIGQWRVDCKQYNGRRDNSAKMQSLTFSENRGKIFVTVGDSPVTSISKNFEQLVDVAYKMAKKSIMFEGSRFQVGDIVVKLGSVTMASSVKGMVLEIMYLSCHSLAEGDRILKEILDLLGTDQERFIPVESTYQDLPEEFTDRHTALQYFEALKMLKLIGTGNMTNKT